MLRDNVMQRSVTAGTGAKVLGDVVAGFRSFAAAFSSGPTLAGSGGRPLVFACLKNEVDDGAFETGVYELDATAGTLSPVEVLESSAGGAAVNWPPGTRLVWCAPPGRRTLTARSGVAATPATAKGMELLAAADAAAVRAAAGAAPVEAPAFVGLASANAFRAGADAPQTDAAFRARGGYGNSYEWGHGHPAGYGSTLGFTTGGGQPFVAFNAEAGSTGNTFRTRGKKGTLLVSDLEGGLVVGTIPNPNADNQPHSTLLHMRGDGNLVLGAAPSNEGRLNIATGDAGNARISAGPTGSGPMLRSMISDEGGASRELGRILFNTVSTHSSNYQGALGFYYTPPASPLTLGLYLDSGGRLISGGSTARADGYEVPGAVTLPAAAGIRARNTVKAWVTWQILSGVPTILDAFNVYAITRNAIADYTLHLSHAMANTNYAVFGMSKIDETTSINNWPVGVRRVAGAQTTTSCRIDTQGDPLRCYIAILGS
jgi:hypothetical protein